MRLVAAVFVGLLAFAILHPNVAAGTDDCSAAGQQCVQLDVPGTPANAQASTYYLYAKGANCLGGPSCNLLWQETNCDKGLQRAIDVNGCDGRPLQDTPVL